jgi:uncharacterized membrane protein
MQTTTPWDLVVTAYASEEAAENVLKSLLEAAGDGLVQIKVAVTLRKDLRDELHIVDRKPAALLVGLDGFVIGVVAWPAGWDLCGAAAIIDLPARIRDGSFLDSLRALGRRLPAGHSAIVVVTNHRAISRVKQLVTGNGRERHRPGRGAMDDDSTAEAIESTAAEALPRIRVAGGEPAALT